MLWALLLSASVAFARGRNTPGEAEIARRDYRGAVARLEPLRDKGADEWYLLGEAYFQLNDKRQAHAAWRECLAINERLSRRQKWTFLFPPRARLSAQQKQRLKDEFEDRYRALNATIARSGELAARERRSEAARAEIEASRREADRRALERRSEAAGESARARQPQAERLAERAARVADNARRAPVAPPRSRPRPRGEGGGMLGYFIFGGIFLLIILAVLFGKPRRRDEEYYEVSYDDDRFGAGPFWYEGRRFYSNDEFYDAYGYHYTNRMYRDNYARWGRGQSPEELRADADHMRVEEEIDEAIRAQEELAEAAAEAGRDADYLEADAAEARLDADEIEAAVAEGDELAESFDDGHVFTDDEPADDQFADDQFTDDDPEGRN